MRGNLKIVAAGGIAILALAGCRKLAEPFGQPAATHGRYAGIGIYGPGQSWTKMVAAQQAKETPSAQTKDDDAIIVVVDSLTGEVRGCGNMTGFCVGMNPWKTQLVAGQMAPVQLTEHVNSAKETLAPTAAPPGLAVAASSE